MAAVYDGLPRLLCPHVLGRNREGRLRAFCYQYGGSSGSGLRMGPEGMSGWRCIAVDKLSHVELRTGVWRTEPRASRQSCVEEIDFDADAHPGDDPQKGSVGVAAVTPDPKRCVAWRSSADYAARGERGDPRGRKSGAGPGAMNAR